MRCADKATAEKVKSQSPPSVIFLDADGEEYYRTVISVKTLEDVFKKALEMYSSKEIAWAPGEPASGLSQARDSRKLLALTFLDDKKDSESFVETLQDRWIVKHHGKVVFQKRAFSRDSEECKEWGVSMAPTLLLVDPCEEDARKRVVDRLTGKKSVPSVRAFLVKNIEKYARQVSSR